MSVVTWVSALKARLIRWNQIVLGLQNNIPQIFDILILTWSSKWVFLGSKFWIIFDGKYCYVKNSSLYRSSMLLSITDHSYTKNELTSSAFLLKSFTSSFCWFNGRIISIVLLLGTFLSIEQYPFELLRTISNVVFFSNLQW